MSASSDLLRKKLELEVLIADAKAKASEVEERHAPLIARLPKDSQEWRDACAVQEAATRPVHSAIKRLRADVRRVDLELSIAKSDEKHQKRTEPLQPQDCHLRALRVTLAILQDPSNWNDVQAVISARQRAMDTIVMVLHPDRARGPRADQTPRAVSGKGESHGA